MAKISKSEFDRAMSTLRHKGLSDTDIRDLKNKFSGDLHEDSLDKGISSEEFKRALKDMHEHPSQHHLSKSQLKKAEEELGEDL